MGTTEPYIYACLKEKDKKKEKIKEKKEEKRMELQHKKVTGEEKKGRVKGEVDPTKEKKENRK